MLIAPRSLAAAFASAVLLAQSSLAHSLDRDPIDYVTIIGNAAIKAPARRVHSHSNFDLTFTLHDGQQKIRLALEPNHDVIHDELTISYLGDDGEIVQIEPIDRRQHRVYRGHSYVQRGADGDWSRAGWARIMVHRDGDAPIFDGAFRIDGDNHHIQSGNHYFAQRHEKDPMVKLQTRAEEVMIVWRDSDVISSRLHRSESKRDQVEPDGSCKAHSLNFNSVYDAKLYNNSSLSGVDSRSLFGRQNIDGGGQGSGGGGVNLLDSIGSVDGCPTTRKVALLGIATDCSYAQAFDNPEDIQKNVISMVNKASEVYESTFKISLGLKNITVSKKECPGTPSSSAPWNIGCVKGTDIGDRLSLFSGWRGQFKDDLAYWTLLTNCNTDKDGNPDSAVGLAWRGQLCRVGSASNSGSGSGNNETIAGTNVVVKKSTEWQIFAHESGHTFGAVHDCARGTCPFDPAKEVCCQLSKNSCDAEGQFIMNPSTAPDISKFSPCSIGNICSGLKANIDGKCLSDNKNVDIISGNQCGNGIVEKGEDCDCGGEAGCKDNKCCDPKTCKFVNDAVCDPTNEDCCNNQCKFASTSTVCRPSTGSCDPEEKCPGDSASCPDDKHKNDGDSCGDNGLQCASGQCTSRDLQCKIMVSSQSGTNDTSACSSQRSACLVTCQAPRSGSNQCIQYNQDFLDGTSCGAGGHCFNGFCNGSSGWKEFVQWLKDHKNIVIPVGSVLAALLALCILSSLYKCIRRRMRRRRVPKPLSSNSVSSWPSVQRQNQGQWQGQNQGWQGQGQEQWQLDHFQNDQWQRADQWNQPQVPPPQPTFNAGGYPHPGTPDQQGRWNRPGPARYA